MYEIAADRANRRVELDFVGSYADIDPADLARDLRAAVQRVKGGSTHFDLLVDFTRGPVIPQNITHHARNDMAWCLANGLRRSANVMTSTIAKLQVQRLSPDDRFRTFTSRAEAVAWLCSPD